MDEFTQTLLCVCCSAIGLIAVGVVVAALALGSRSRGTTAHAFLAAADTLGLNAESSRLGGPRLAGHIEKRPVKVTTGGHSRNAVPGTHYQVMLEHAAIPRFMVTHRGLVSEPGGTSIASGDADFDAVYGVSCLDRTVGAALIADSAVREAIKAAGPETIIIERTEVYIKDRDTAPPPERMRQMLELATLLAARAEAL